MKKIFACMGVCLLNVLFLGDLAQANREDPLFKQFPQNYEFSLKNGEKVLLPFHIYKGQSVFLGGYADLKILTEYLKPHHVVPAPLSANLGLIGVYIINYMDTVIGPYHEIFVMVAIRQNHSPMPDLMKTYFGLLSTYAPFLKTLLGTESENIGFFAWKLWVDTDIALRVGHEVWGYPKSIANIDVDIKSHSTRFQVGDQNGMILAGGFKRYLPLVHIFPLRMDFYSTTPRDIQQTTGRALVNGRFSLHYVGGNDHFEFNSQNSWGKIFRDVQFQPLFWQHIENLRSVVLMPN